MATTGEIADNILDLRTKFAAVLKAQGWPEDMVLNSIQAYLPAYSLSFILDYINFTAERVRSLSDVEVKRDRLGEYLSSVPVMLASIQFNNLPNDPVNTINGLMMTLQLINARLPSDPRGPVPLDWQSVEDKSLFPKDIAKRVRAMEAGLTRLEPRSAEIEKKISDIEAAHAAAEQLPEDLEELAEKRSEVKKIVDEAKSLLDQIIKITSNVRAQSDGATTAMGRISDAEIKADRLVERSEQALRGSTGVGLANAFEKRKSSLTLSGAAWVVGLLVALLAAVAIGAERVATLQSLLKNDSPTHIVWMNLILTIFGVGGPIWFAWLSTKQIAVNFRLAEDYAFKAAVSKAYEGYRKEAIEIDPALQKRLFSSALDRLEEPPIRLMEKEMHSSPLQELLSNPSIRKSLDSIPGIADKIIALIPAKGTAAVVAPATAIATVTGVIGSVSEKKSDEVAEKK